LSDSPWLVGVDHVAIAAVDPGHPLVRLLEWPRMIDKVMPSGVHVAKYGLGGTQIEVVNPECAPTPIDRFLAQRGPGLHHVALIARGDLSEIQATLSRLGLGPGPIESAADGRPSLFLHPQSCGGVLIEIVQDGR